MHLRLYRDHPEVQDKIRRVVEQGFIDPEDFKGVSFIAQHCTFRFHSGMHLTDSRPGS